MSTLARTPVALSATLVALIALTACSGGSDSGAVAQVGDVTITKAAINHWMGTLAGGDYYQLSGRQTLPAGLVSEPPDYPACVAHLETAEATSPSKDLRLTGVQLLAKCRQLYQALKRQATEFLVNSEWTIAAYRDAGVTASDREVRQRFEQWRAREGLTSNAALNKFMASHRRSIADEMSVIKLDVLAQKAQRKVNVEGGQAIERFRRAEKKWASRTTCRPGYVVQHCKQQRAVATQPVSSLPSPSVLMEQVAALATGRCINLPACAKQ